jgi:hypothetical protein
MIGRAITICMMIILAGVGTYCGQWWLVVCAAIGSQVVCFDELIAAIKENRKP